MICLSLLQASAASGLAVAFGVSYTVLLFGIELAIVGNLSKVLFQDEHQFHRTPHCPG